MQLHGASDKYSLNSSSLLKQLVFLRRFIGSFYSFGFLIIFLYLGNYPAAFVVLLMAIAAPVLYGYASLMKNRALIKKIPDILSAFFALSIIFIIYFARELSFIYIIAYPTTLAVYSSSKSKYKWAVLTLGIVIIAFILQGVLETYPLILFITTYVLVFSFSHLFSMRIKADHKTLSALALTDSLTGLQNRRALELDMGEPEEFKKVKSIIFLDIDHFKDINDKYGHVFGDEVIKAAANVITHSIDQTDKAYRYGGEEFIITSQGETECQDKALKIKSAIEKIRIIKDTYTHDAVTFTASVGVAPNTGQKNPSQLIRCADDAMYHAKETGRNRVVLCSDSKGYKALS